MGPIEKELREVGAPESWRWTEDISFEAWKLACAAAEQLGARLFFGPSLTCDAEVLSEAIEAAEALGL